MAHRSVSVVIPSFNRAHLLPETLDAVLTQTCPPEEVIVVDDGSTDGTAELVTQYAPRVTLRTIPNSGDLAARNRGLAAASGNLVAFCDSDDLWHPELLQEMQALWQAEPELRAAFANFRIVRDGQWQAGDKFSEAPPGFWSGMRELGGDRAAFDWPIVERLIRFQPFFPSCLVAERQFLLSIGGWDESVGRVVGTDFATMLRLAEHAPLGVVRRPLVGIRKHGTNYSGDVQAMNLGDAAILEHVLAQRPSLRPYAAEIAASVGQRRREALDTAFARRDFAAVQSIFTALPDRERGRAQRVKRAVAMLPPPLGSAAAAVLLRLGSWHSAAG
ncbi:MAG: hypothetical protein JWR10_506 [Rubritepida sp.]|nr:hypothetical protein [Rubritepida sp.]